MYDRKQRLPQIGSRTDPKGLKLQNPTLATKTVRSPSSLPENLTADVHHAINECESSGSGKQLILHGNPSALARDFSPHMAVLRRHFLHFQTLGGDFDIFATSSESTAWVLLWKTRSIPIGVRVCPVAQCLDFFSTAFDPRKWTMVVFWKEDSERQRRLITPENGGGDETSSPSPPRFTSFDDPDVPLGPCPPGPPLAPPGPLGQSDSPGLPPGLLPTPPPAGGKEKSKS